LLPRALAVRVVVVLLPLDPLLEDPLLVLEVEEPEPDDVDRSLEELPVLRPAV
jgi:hypothetical protein